jgi:hypothetical protein
MGGVMDVVMVLVLLGGGYFLWSSGELQKLLSSTGIPIQLPPAPSIPGLPAPSAPAPTPSAPAPSGGGRGGRGGGEAGSGGGGGGGGSEEAAPPPTGGGSGPATLTGGDCAKTIYAGTGNNKDNSKRTKQGTRHYASGKPDDVTSEWGTSVNFKNYEFTAYMTITEVDHDDTASMKFGGTHNGSGWYDNGVGFNNGDFCMGKEENHPSTDLCVVKGKSIGSILNKKIGIKCIIVGAGTGQAQLEMWGDRAANGQWEQMIPRQNGVGGFFPSSAEQECTIRIDAAPGITMHCSSVNEISGWTRGGGGAGAGPSPGIPPTQPVQPASGGGQSPQSGGGEPVDSESGGGGEESGGGSGGGEESGGNGGGSESNYGRVNRYRRSYRVSYY